MGFFKICALAAFAASAITFTDTAIGQEPKGGDPEMTEEQKTAFMKRWVGSKFAIKEFCKVANPGKAAEFDAAWANYLAMESSVGKAYGVSPAIAAESAEQVKDFAGEAERSASAREGLMLTCDGALKGQKF